MEYQGLSWRFSGWLCLANAGGMGSIHGQGTKILHAACGGQKKQNKEENGIQRMERRPMKTWSVGHYTFGQTLEKYNIHSEP